MEFGHAGVCALSSNQDWFIGPPHREAASELAWAMQASKRNAAGMGREAVAGWMLWEVGAGGWF
eukprot:COSAG02_NODE_2435_length_8869_cov_63.273774_4_plen_64_part_00